MYSAMHLNSSATNAIEDECYRFDTHPAQLAGWVSEYLTPPWLESPTRPLGKLWKAKTYYDLWVPLSWFSAALKVSPRPSASLIPHLFSARPALLGIVRLRI